MPNSNFKLFRSRSRTMDVSVGVGVPIHPAKEKPPINVVGDVGGRIAIMVVRYTPPCPLNISTQSR